LLSCFASAQRYGSITGTVLDANGIAIPAAKVTAQYICVSPCVMHTALPQEQTDNEGHYVFKRLGCGRYSVSAEKPEDDYPPLYLWFYSGEKQPEVQLSGTSASVTVDLKLSKKAGIVVGTVADAETGNPIDAYVEFRATTDQRRFLGSGLSAQFRMLVPSDTPVMMKVSHPGYEDWWFTRNAVIAPVQVGSGESLKIEVRLKKASSEQSQSR
jgi:hypothetical protein